MDQIKTGQLIRLFRTKLGLTQRQLAECINVSDKAVSKWENGKGCPDVDLLSELSAVFGTDVQVLLTGELEKNTKESGNMKKMRFYICNDCGNIITAASGAGVICCGNKLSAIDIDSAEKSEVLKTEDYGSEWHISSEHPMTKEHNISFVAFLTDSSMMMFRQYPEWEVNIDLPKYRSGKLLCYCSKCGLLCKDITPGRA